MPICDSLEYAEHKMQAKSKAFIEELSKKITKHYKRVESKYVFRKILNAALPDKKWAEYCTEEILEIYGHKLTACKCMLYLKALYFVYISSFLNLYRKYII